MEEPAGSLQEPAREETEGGAVDEEDRGHSPSGKIYIEFKTRGIEGND